MMSGTITKKPGGDRRVAPSSPLLNARPCRGFEDAADPRERRDARGRRLSRACLLVLAGLALAACSSTGSGEEGGGRLPFLVRVQPVAFSAPAAVSLKSGGGDDSGAEPSNPALFADPEELTETLADALDEARVFSVVVTGNDVDIPADLELEVTISGNDFGAGQPTVGGSLLSSFLWLFTGHLSWFIDNRVYPDSNVILHVALKSPGLGKERPVTVFSNDLFITDLGLSLIERASPTDWFSSILVPPWCGEGDPEVAGASLARRAVDHFRRNEPDRIIAGLPPLYLEGLSSFLVHDPESEELIIVTREEVDGIEIKSPGGRRFMDHDEANSVYLLAEEATEERDGIRLRLARLQAGIGTSTSTGADGERYYRVPLLDTERGFVRIQAFLGDKVGRWTIFRPDGGVTGTGVAPQ